MTKHTKKVIRARKRRQANVKFRNTLIAILLLGAVLIIFMALMRWNDTHNEYIQWRNSQVEGGEQK